MTLGLLLLIAIGIISVIYGNYSICKFFKVELDSKAQIWYGIIGLLTFVIDCLLLAGLVAWLLGFIFTDLFIWLFTIKLW